MTDIHRPTSTGRGSRRIELIRASWGAALLLTPRAVLAGALRVSADERPVVVARILGARHLTQATLSGLRPSPEVLAMGVWVDTVHAATAVALAACDPGRARAALTDALVAAGWASAGYRDLIAKYPTTAPSSDQRSHQRRRDQLARAVLRVVPGGHTLLEHADNRDSAGTGGTRTDQEGHPHD